jgi:LysM repeat protein
MENWKRYLNEVSEISTHVVKEKENLTKIAKMYGVPLADLESANSEIEDTDLILVGQKINIPNSAGDLIRGNPPPDPDEEEDFEIKIADLISRISETVNDEISQTDKLWAPALKSVQAEHLLTKAAKATQNDLLITAQAEKTTNALKSFYRLFYSGGSGIILEHSRKSIDEIFLNPREQKTLGIYLDGNAWHSLLGGLYLIKLAVLTSPIDQPMLSANAYAYAMGDEKDWFEEYDLADYADIDIYGPIRKSARLKARHYLDQTDAATGRTLETRFLRGLALSTKRQSP